MSGDAPPPATVHTHKCRYSAAPAETNDPGQLLVDGEKRQPWHIEQGMLGTLVLLGRNRQDREREEERGGVGQGH